MAILRVFAFVAFLGAVIFPASEACGQGCPSTGPSVLAFDGASDYGIIPSGPALGGFVDFTIEAWVRTALSTATGYALSKELAGTAPTVQDSYSIAITPPGVITFSINNGGFRCRGTTPIADFEWHHIAVTRSAGAVRLFVDGNTELLSQVSGDPAIAMNSNVTPLQIGCRLDGSTQLPSPASFWSGRIDEIRIWNIALAQSQLQTRSTTILIGVQPGLVGYWRLDDGAASPTNQILADLSPMGQSGTRGASALPWGDDPEWILVDSAPLFYPGVGGLVGQPNGPQGRLEINGAGATTVPGPFFVNAAGVGSLVFNWSGDPGQPFILFTGPLNVANSSSPNVGTVDIGTPCTSPPFSDVLVVLDGTLPSGLLFRTNSAGTASQVFSIPTGITPGTRITFQGALRTAAGGFRLTAATQVIL